MVMGASMKHVVSEKMLRNIIREELATIVEADDVSDAQERSNVIKVASDLMKTINVFREKATESMKSHVDKSLDDVYKILVDMTNNPHSYVDKQVVATQAVKKSFKPEGDVIK